jgi:hypothetical protein
MRTLGIILGSIALFIAVLIGGGFAWYKINYPTYTFRYRMTVEVDVDGVVHSGSSVIEVSINRQPPFGSAPPYVPHIRGEAVFVDLGEGRNVIALLAAGPRAENVNYSDSIVPGLFDLPFKDWAKLSDLRGTREVPVSRMPTFVTFTDLNEPKSARVLAPGEFEQVFGPGVHFRRAFVEMVPAGTWPFSALGWPRDLAGEPVTRGIFQRLPWLAGFKGYSGGQGQPDWSRPEKNLTGNLFTRGAIR